MAPLQLLEHLNLFVPEAELARAFYTGLGCALNPVGTNERQVHVNLGVSQFHCPFKRNVIPADPVEIAQKWAGRIELLTTEPLAAVLARLREIPSADAQLVGAGAEAVLQVRGPWDDHRAFELRAAPGGLAEAVAASGRGHAGGSGAVLAMPRLVHPCRVGCADRIAAFYSEIMCADGVEVVTREDGRRAAVVTFSGPGGAAALTQRLEFEEAEDAPPSDAYDHDEARRYHLAIYTADEAAFETAFRRAEAAGIVWVNERFEGAPPEFASPKTWAEAGVCQQFRVKDLIDPRTKELGIVLEHEIRSPSHRCCPFSQASGATAPQVASPE